MFSSSGSSHGGKKRALVFNSWLYFGVSECWLALGRVTEQLTEALLRCRKGNRAPQCRNAYQTKHQTNLSHFHFSTQTAATLNIHDNKLALTYGITDRKKNTGCLCS